MVSLGHLEVSLPIQTLDFNTGENQIHSYIGTDDSDEFRYNVQIDVEKGCRISIKILPLRSSRNDGTIKTFVKQVVKVNPTMNIGNTNPNTNATISKPPIISTNTFNQSSSISTNTSTITTNTLPPPTPDSVRKAKQPMVMVRKLPEAKSKAPPEQPEQQAKQQQPEQQPPELEVEDIKDFAMSPDVDDSYEADDTTLQTDGNASGVAETIAVQGSDGLPVPVYGQMTDTVNTHKTSNPVQRTYYPYFNSQKKHSFARKSPVRFPSYVEQKNAYRVEKAVCQYCYKVFKNRESRRVHIIRYHKDATFSPQTSTLLPQSGDNAATIAHNNLSHLRSIAHGDVDPVVCIHCDKVFKNANSRRVHYYRSHRAELGLSQDYIYEAPATQSSGSNVTIDGATNIAPSDMVVDDANSGTFGDENRLLCREGLVNPNIQVGELDSSIAVYNNSAATNRHIHATNYVFIPKKEIP